MKKSLIIGPFAENKEAIEKFGTNVYISHLYSETIQELSTFEIKGSSYEATQGNHDDLVMNLVMFAWFVSSEAFGNISTIDLKEMLFSEKMKQIEEDVPPFGEIDDGISFGTVYDDMANKMREWNNL